MIERQSDRLHLVFVVGLGLLQFFVLLGHGSLWDIDEGMHAVIAKNMLVTGDWVTPVFNGEAFLDKPALFNWLVAGSFRIFGFTEFAARAPAALAGLGSILLTYRLGRESYDSATGLLAAVVLATSLMFAIVSRVVIYDLPFAFFTTLALYVFCMAVLREDWRHRRILWFYVACGLAVMVKGPLGVAVPATIVAVYVFVERQWSLLRDLRIPQGVVLFLAVVAPWFVMMERANPGYLEYFIVQQHFANFLGDAGTHNARHPEPWFFYIPYLLVGIFPWTVFLPQSLRLAFRKKTPRIRKFTVALLVWMAVVLIVFSAASSKLPTYILPMFPAVALLIGYCCRNTLWAPDSNGHRGILLGLGCIMVPIVAALTYGVVADAWEPLNRKYGVQSAELNVMLAGVVALLAGAMLFVALRRGRIAVATLAAVTPFVVLYLTGVVVPDVSPYRGSQEIGVAYDKMLPAGAKMVFCGQLLDSAMFYTGREAVLLDDGDQLEDYLSDGLPAIIRIRSGECAEVLNDSRNSVTVVGNKALVARTLAAGQGSSEQAAGWSNRPR